jgi:MIP family channel proteins
MADKNLRAYLAELFGTFALVFISAGAVWANFLNPNRIGVVGVALAAGLVYAAALAVTLPISGGFLNPAVTIMLWVFRRFDGQKTALLLFVQVLGAALAGLVLRALFGSPEDVARASHLGAPHLIPDVVGTTPIGSRLKGIGVELVLTFVLTFAIFGTFLDPRGSRIFSNWAGRLAPLWIGLVLLAGTLVGYGVTGAAMNPARWFGPAVFFLTLDSNALSDHVVYWVGPIAGALLAGWAYTALILPEEEETRPAAQATTAKVGAAPAAVSSTLFRARK